MSIDVNKPVENPKLSELLKQRAECIRQNDEEAKAKLDSLMNRIAEEVCMNAHFLAPVKLSEPPERNDDGTVTLQKDTTVGFVMLNGRDNTRWHPAFTDWNELSKWKNEVSYGEQPQTLILSFDDFSGMIGGNTAVKGLVINPFSDNITLTREVLASWAETKKQILAAPKTESHIVRGGVDILKKDTRVRIGDPAEYPQKLTEALKSHAKTERKIKRMWLRQVQFEGKQPEFCLIVEHKGEDREIFDALGGAAQGLLNQTQMCVVNAESEFGVMASKGTKPFYKSALFG
ncbi:MAG: enhanced serine sensitivity protein SseB C-terminal domain-containing protein [Oscillospiraceae bacterium]